MMVRTIGLVTLIALSALTLNIDAQSWQQMNDIPFPGRHHGIGFSLNGEGYVLTGSETTSYWKYDPVADSWLDMGDYPGMSRGFSIGDTYNGKAYFGFGRITVGPGQSFSTNDLWEYDPVADSFAQLTSCPCNGRTHPAFVVLQDKIFVGLGYDGSNLGDWWEYDIPTDSWSQKPDLPGAARHHPYQFAIGNYVYVGSGHQTDWFRYDPAAETWSQVATLPGYTRVAGTQFEFGGKGYVLSGVGHLNGGQHNPMPTGEFWEYDPSLDTWTELTPHPGQSVWAPASFILDDFIYMVSGDDQTNQNVYRYDLAGISTSVNEDQRVKLTVHPNPASHLLRIHGLAMTASTRVTAISTNGKEMRLEHDLNGTVDIRGLAKGLYVLRVQTNDAVLNTPFVKE